MPRIQSHPILGQKTGRRAIKITVDGIDYTAYEGETIAAALLAEGQKVLRHTHKYHQPRGVFCAVGKCTDCMMTVNGVPNVRTCITFVEENMLIKTQQGLGQWERSEKYDT